MVRFYYKSTGPIKRADGSALGEHSSVSWAGAEGDALRSLKVQAASFLRKKGAVSPKVIEILNPLSQYANTNLYPDYLKDEINRQEKQGIKFVVARLSGALATSYFGGTTYLSGSLFNPDHPVPSGLLYMYVRHEAEKHSGLDKEAKAVGREVDAWNSLPKEERVEVKKWADWYVSDITRRGLDSENNIIKEEFFALAEKVKSQLDSFVYVRHFVIAHYGEIQLGKNKEKRLWIYSISALVIFLVCLCAVLFLDVSIYKASGTFLSIAAIYYSFSYWLTGHKLRFYAQGGSVGDKRDCSLSSLAADLHRPKDSSNPSAEAQLKKDSFQAGFIYIGWIERVFRKLLSVLGLMRNGKQANKQNEYQHASQEYIQSSHYQSPSLLRNVPTIKAAIKISSPTTNKLKRNGVAEINCPTTKAVKVNLPTSYSAFASSLRWVLSNFIPILKQNLAQIISIVKTNLAAKSIFKRLFNWFVISLGLSTTVLNTGCVNPNAIPFERDPVFKQLLCTLYIMREEDREKGLVAYLVDHSYLNDELLIESPDYLKELWINQEELLYAYRELLNVNKFRASFYAARVFAALDDPAGIPILIKGFEAKYNVYTFIPQGGDFSEETQNEIREYVKTQSAFALAQLGNPIAISHLKYMLSGEPKSSSAARAYAAYSLSMFEDQEILDALIKFSDDPDKAVRLECLRGLLNFNDPKLFDIFVKALDDKDAAAVDIAVAGLAASADKRAVPYLAKIIEEAKFAQTKIIALTALYQVEAEEVLPIVIKESGNPDSEIKRSALSILAQIDKPESKKVLIEALSDPEPLVRAIAASGLVTIKNDGTEISNLRDRSIHSYPPESQKKYKY